MIQKIYLVRHGQTDYNLKGIVQGSGVDASLNEMGRMQAAAFYKMYKTIPFDRLYFSKLKRSKESVQSFISDGIKHDELEALNEICWGNKEGQPITPQEDVYYHWILKQWQEGRTSLPVEGGESPDEVAQRQRSFLETLRSRPEDKNILVCMHGRAMRILLCQMLNYPLRSMDMFEHRNLCLYVVHFSGNQFAVQLYNNTDHLLSIEANTKPKMVSVKK
jgi:broad specificity phosphatase PhoE